MILTIYIGNLQLSVMKISFGTFFVYVNVNIKNKQIMISQFTKSKPTEIDWATEYSVLALNLSTMQFENTSMIGPKSKISLNIYLNSADHSEEVAEMAKKVNATFLLYTTDHWCVGFVEEYE